MQSFNTNGFVMDFNDMESNKYLEIKNAIEHLCCYSITLSKLYNRDPLIHYLAISKGTYITCIVKDEIAEFGIFKSGRSEILQHITKDFHISLHADAITELENRMERMARYPTHMKPEPIYSLWIEKIKEKASNSKSIENDERDFL